MKTPIDPNAPAYPFKQSTEVFYHPDTYHRGMTIRAEFAKAALQGLLSNVEIREDFTRAYLIDEAVDYADALISRLNREEAP